jgi:hypothetical protein
MSRIHNNSPKTRTSTGLEHFPDFFLIFPQEIESFAPERSTGCLTGILI